MPAIMDGHDTGYTRNMPNRFSEERDDRLMNSMVGSYAREIFIKGEPTGHHFLNKADAKAMSAEVIATHKRDDRLAGDEEMTKEQWAEELLTYGVFFVLMQEDADKCYLAGVTEILTKPIDAQQLLGLVATYGQADKA